ncbi:MAG: NADH-quinone oxidoreductase subunit C [Candidatus Binataceae bacterium]
MLIDTLKQRFGSELLTAESSHGDEVITVSRDAALSVLRALRDEADFDFNFLIDLTGVDWPAREPRFEVVYNLKSLKRNNRLRVKVPVPENDAWVFSAVELWKSADWLERECYDMFGIDFRNHPDLRRILLYDSFVGHPLRKDYPVDRRQPLAEEIDPVASPRPSSR